MPSDGRYELSQDIRKAYESLSVAMAIYQFVNDKCVTLLVTDGLCKLFGTERAALTYEFDTDMFGRLHPDDVEMLANLGMNYAIHGTNYDTVVRIMRPDKNGYMLLHTTARPVILDDGTRIDFFTYADVTNIDMGIRNSFDATLSPKAKFLDENVGAVAVVSKEYNILFYCNNAMKALIPPQRIFDSGIRFNDYFYPDIPDGIKELSHTPTDGLHYVTDPRTGNKLIVSVLSCRWLDEPSSAMYFYKTDNDSDDSMNGKNVRNHVGSAKTDGTTLHSIFNTVIFSGVSDAYPITSPNYRGFSSWNIETGELVASSGKNCIAGLFAGNMKYDEFILTAVEHISSEHSEIIQSWNSAQLINEYPFGTYMHEATVKLNVGYEIVPVHIKAALMRSPDDNCIYIRFSEENISNSIFEKAVFLNAVAHEFEFVAFIDAETENCRILYGQSSNETEKNISARLGEYYPIIAKMMGRDAKSCEDLLKYIESECSGGIKSVKILETSAGEFKNISISAVNEDEKLYYITRLDITETVLKERAREKELTEAKDKAEQATTAVQQFLAGVSHDLRTPLNGIIGFTELAMITPDCAKKQEYIGKISASGKLMLDLVNDVLDTSKIASGQLELIPQTVDSRVLLHGIKESISLLAEQKKISFFYNVDEKYPDCIFTDKLRLQQIVLNLLSNSIKYTPDGGEVSFRVNYIEAPENGCNTCVTVMDTGIGMSEEFQKRMFDPFTQERQVQYAGIQGTGLGLFIVNRIVELMGGKIDVKSSVGCGSIFKIYLPIEIAKHGELSENKKSTLPDIKGCRILLAEDNDINAEIASAILIERGHAEVERASDGKQALEKFMLSNKGCYDAILMDIRMPIMNGIEAAKAIRALNRPDAKTIPIIAMTADAFAEDVKKCLDAGMNGYIPKPINSRIMFEELRKSIV